MELHVGAMLGQVLERLRVATEHRDGLPILAESLVASVPCDRATIWTRGSRDRPFRMRAAHPALANPEEPRPELSLEGAVVGDLVRGRCARPSPTTLVGDLAALRTAMELTPGGDILLIPFLHGGRLEAFAACGRQNEAFTPDQIAIWNRIAPHVATVLTTWRLEAVQTSMRMHRRHFASLAADVLGATDVEACAVRICELTRALFDTTRSAFFVLEESDLVPIAAAGPYGDRAGGRALHVPPGVEPIFDEAVRTKQVIVVNDFHASPYAATPIPLPFRPKAALVIPLVDAGGLLGLLTASELDQPQRFGPETAEQAQLLGAVTTVAIRRMLLVEDLRRASRAKDDFLTAVSHELRTPLNVVLGYLQLLGEYAFGPLTSEQEDTIRRIEKGARSQLSLVNDLLDLAGIERGNLQCALEQVRMVDLVGELGDVVRSIIGKRAIAFEVDVPDSIVLHTDRERLKQVLINLLGNAAKFTTHGEIALRAVATAGSVLIEVADTGVGMEPGFIGRATEPFVRGEGNGVGSGLGLAIVSRVLRALGGSIAIDSQPGIGTTVRILVPSAEQQTATLPAAS